MFDISRKMKDVLVFDDEVYPLNLAFDNIIRLIEMVNDDDVQVLVKPALALRMLLKATTDEELQRNLNLINSLSIEEVFEVYKSISDEHILIKDAKAEAPEYDLAGNLIEKKANYDNEKKKKIFSLKYDGDYIYASFLQAYNIDLIEVQGDLHWKKFNALLNGLPKSAKFSEVVKIRTWKPQKGDKQQFIDSMRSLQKEYELPKNVDY